MLSAYFHAKHLLHFFLILWIEFETSHGVSSAVGNVAIPESDGSTQLNFFQSALRGRQRLKGGGVSCVNDPAICLDRQKNPWGGTMCCFQQWCIDTLRDSNNCGECGLKCGFGSVCCDGRCVDIRNDPRHCGSCFEVCHGKCSFAMCDYGG